MTVGLIRPDTLKELDHEKDEDKEKDGSEADNREGQADSPFFKVDKGSSGMVVFDLHPG